MCVSLYDTRTEAAIILDLLQQLTSHIRSLEISSQRQLMKRKYALLSTRVKAGNRSRAFQLAQRALEEGNLLRLLLPSHLALAACEFLSAASDGRTLSLSD